MKTVDFENQEEITAAIEQLRALCGGPVDMLGNGRYASDTTRAHSPRQHVVIFRTTCLDEAKAIEKVVNAMAGYIREDTK